VSVVVCGQGAGDGGDLSVGAQMSRRFFGHSFVQWRRSKWCTGDPLRLIEGEASQASAMERIHVSQVLVLRE
jgi:hypothetical protein